MNYYPHHIGDFRSGTINMTRLERWIYRDLLDIYYDTEKQLPLELEKVCDLVGARSDEECKIVAYLLRSKFQKLEGGHWHERCHNEIIAYHSKAETARNNGKNGGRPKNKPVVQKPTENQAGFELEPTGLPIETGLKANQEPITKNHKPRTKVKAESASPVGDDALFPDVDQQVVADYKALRKRKGAPVTKTSMDMLAREAEKAGLTLEGALRVCCARGWQSLKAEWILKDQPAAGRSSGPHPAVSTIEAQRAATNAANNAEAKRLLFGTKPDEEGKVIENA